MTTEETRALASRWGEMWIKGKTAVLTGMDEICSPDIVAHESFGERRGLKELKQSTSAFYDAFPDLQFTVHDVIVEGDKAVGRFTLTGTFKGAFMGIPPNNKKITSWAIEIDRFAGGKLVEYWGRADTLGLMQQLGVMPAPKK